MFQQAARELLADEEVDVTAVIDDLFRREMRRRVKEEEEAYERAVLHGDGSGPAPVGLLGRAEVIPHNRTGR